MKPRISVVVTHWNHHKFLPEALASLGNQTLRPFEVILIDDGSDRRPALPAGCENVTGIFAPHRGIGAALNTAIAVMRGDVCCWLPADDLWKPHKLERQADFATAHPGCVLHSYCDVWQDDSFVCIGTVQDATDEEFAAKIRCSSPYFANTFWIPKQILDRVGLFREDVHVSEDYQWVLRSVVYYNTKYRLQKESLTIKRRHANTTTARYATDIPALVEAFNREL